MRQAARTAAVGIISETEAKGWVGNVALLLVLLMPLLVNLLLLLPRDTHGLNHKCCILLFVNATREGMKNIYILHLQL